MSPTQAARRLRVLCTSPAPSDTRNPYVALTVRSVSSGAHTSYFTWPRALFGRYELVHAHWPESLGRGTTRSRQIAKQLLTLLFIARLTFTRTPVVRTLHNLRPHEPSRNRIDRFLIHQFDSLTRQWIRLNPDTPTPDESATTTIPHGLYPVAPAEDPAPQRGVLCYFGFIRPYKAVPQLLSTFRGVSDPAFRLNVLGKPLDATVETEVTVAAAGDPRIHLDLRVVPEADLHAAIRTAELIVLPYSEMHNSGAAILALSMGRPVLVPQNSLNDALAEEVGTDWVLRYRGRLSPETLVCAAQQADAVLKSGGTPNLQQRTWEAIGRRTLASYSRALKRQH